MSPPHSREAGYFIMNDTSLKAKRWMPPDVVCSDNMPSDATSRIAASNSAPAGMVSVPSTETEQIAER